MPLLLSAAGFGPADYPERQKAFVGQLFWIKLGVCPGSRAARYGFNSSSNSHGNAKTKTQNRQQFFSFEWCRLLCWPASTTVRWCWPRLLTLLVSNGTRRHEHVTPALLSFMFALKAWNGSILPRQRLTPHYGLLGQLTNHRLSSPDLGWTTGRGRALAIVTHPDWVNSPFYTGQVTSGVQNPPQNSPVLPGIAVI